MGQAITIALIVAVGPIIMSWLTGRQRRAEKLEDWARQDEIKKRVEEVKVTAAAATKGTNEKLDTIQTLVDGRYSELLDQVAEYTRQLAANDPNNAALADQAKAAHEKAQEQAARVTAFDRRR